MSVPPVAAYMTREPRTIDPTLPLDTAHEMMRAHRIRHLPVVDDGRLVGVVSDGDLHLVETLRDVDPSVVLVEEAMTPEPYTVAPDTPLDEVVRTMADHKYGSAIIVDQGRVVGIFTTIDALRALAQLLSGDTTPTPKPST